MRVAVIGAGAAGLAAAKALCEAGMTPEVFEETETVGGLWVYREDGFGPAYRSLRTNTSRQITAYSDFPFSPGVPDFPTRVEVERYLQRYAETFDLVPLIRFGCRVDAVCARERGWSVTAGSWTGDFDAVVICSGIFRKPAFPALPGRASFAGGMLHSLDYRRPEPFAGRDVLVVGLGSSAVDIAADLVGTAARVTLSVRRGAWVAPRFVAGRPLDHYAGRLAAALPARLRTHRRRALLLGEYARRGVDPPATVWAHAGVPFDPEKAPGVGSDSLLPRVMAGEIRVVPAIEQISGRHVILTHGRRLQPDAIIFCTGYGLEFPFLPAGSQPWQDASTGLYRLVFPPHAPTLPFIGVCRVHGPILPIVEMQARWMARVLTGERHLPPAAVMRAEIEERWKRQVAIGDSPIRVSLLSYLDEIGSQIGSRPHLWRHPRLLHALLSGPPVAAQYRLEGPNVWPDAAATILEAAR
jgi:dimethylaniline monooxygenase (N-oxide forming)